MITPSPIKPPISAPVLEQIDVGAGTILRVEDARCAK
jgi:hypothetical protein